VLKLIYNNDLIGWIYKIIKEKTTGEFIQIPHSVEVKVTEILNLLINYKVSYFQSGIIPELHNDFEVNLFNTFRSYFEPSWYPFMLVKKSDHRGFLSEIIKSHCGGQVFFSSSLPGITRGNHFHTRKIERFCVLEGKAVIRFRRTGRKEVHEFTVSGENPCFVDMPVWFTHNITNTGNTNLLTIFWTSEIFNPDDPDTFFEEVTSD